jgi:SAM-dependent methyltransferase
MHETQLATADPDTDSPAEYQCLICRYTTTTPASTELGRAPGNTQRFKSDVFALWQCPGCKAIHSVDAVDMADIYSDYPLNRERTLDVFARGTFRNLLRRLTGNSLRSSDKILDYGCGNGVYIDYLKEEGFADVHGYDPFVPEYADKSVLNPGTYDCVIANDVIEHVDDPRAMMQACASLVKPGGLLYVGTADAEGVDNMADLQRHTMRLHQPFHRVILTPQSLADLGEELGLEQVQAYRRSYMDTLMPFSNYRFLDEFNKAHDHILDRALAPDAAKILLKKPGLLFYAFFGYFMPSAIEPAVLWRVPSGTANQP